MCDLFTALQLYLCLLAQCHTGRAPRALGRESTQDRGEISVLRREVGLREPQGWVGIVIVTDAEGCDKAEDTQVGKPGMPF